MKRMFEKVKDFCVDNLLEIAGALGVIAVGSFVTTVAYNLGKANASTFSFNIDDEILTIKEVKMK